MKPRRDAARYRAESLDAADLIGKFNATQRRERFLVSNRYSHHVVVFRSTIMLVETDRFRDQVRAWAKTTGAVLPLVSAGATSLAAPHVVTQALSWIEKGDSGLAKVVGAMPKSRDIEARLAALEHLTPSLLEEYFPGLVSEVPTTCITSAVLNHGPATVAEKVLPAATVVSAVEAAKAPLSLVPVAPALIDVGPLTAELIIKYRDPERKPELELWLGTNGAEPLDDVARVMREMLGKRFSEQADMWSALRAVGPGRSTRWEL
jgi:hypothetical protein